MEYAIHYGTVIQSPPTPFDQVVNQIMGGFNPPRPKDKYNLFLEEQKKQSYTSQEVFKKDKETLLAVSIDLVIKKGKKNDTIASIKEYDINNTPLFQSIVQKLLTPFGETYNGKTIYLHDETIDALKEHAVVGYANKNGKEYIVARTDNQTHLYSISEQTLVLEETVENEIFDKLVNGETVTLKKINFINEIPNHIENKKFFFYNKRLAIFEKKINNINSFYGQITSNTPPTNKKTKKEVMQNAEKLESFPIIYLDPLKNKKLLSKKFKHN